MGAVITALLTVPIITTPARAQTDAPNIVVIMTDDQRWNLLESMPYVRAQLQDKGITFTKAIVSNPLCCPSRAGFLTGEYSHTNGVWTNRAQGAPGGWAAFKGHEHNTLATWLDGAGYQTGLFGKYLNHYTDPTHIPPGWDRWVAFVGSNGAYYDYDLTVDGQVRSYDDARSDYSTDVLAGYLEEFIEAADPEAPIFAMLTPFAAHAPGAPAPRHRHAKVHVRFPRNRAVNEKDVSDKPRWVRKIDPLTDAAMASLRDVANRQARSLLAVDDAVGQIVAAMADRPNTMYVLMSDHGVEWGEHRWTYKLDPYEQTIRLPLIVRWDDHVAAGTRYYGLVQNIDIAPTFAEIAGASIPTIDGVSIVPLLDGDGNVRRHTLTEHAWYPRGEKGMPPTYCAIRTATHKLVRYETGEEELYDLGTDPHETENVLASRRRARRVFRALSAIADLECHLDV